MYNIMTLFAKICFSVVSTINCYLNFLLWHQLFTSHFIQFIYLHLLLTKWHIIFLSAINKQHFIFHNLLIDNMRDEALGIHGQYNAEE